MSAAISTSRIFRPSPSIAATPCCTSVCRCRRKARWRGWSTRWRQRMPLPRDPKPCANCRADSSSGASARKPRGGLLPGADGLPRRLVQRARDQTALRDDDLVARAVAHRDIDGAAVERVGPWNVAPPRAHQRPHVDLIGRIQRINGTLLVALARDVAVASADTLEPVRGVEPEQFGEGLPLQHPRIDLPLVAR